MGIKFFNSLRDSARHHVDMIRMWLPRKDVSWRFKFLNFLSGDRLRMALVFHEINIKGALCSTTEANEHEGNPDYYGWYAELAQHYAEKAAESIEDIWKI